MLSTPAALLFWSFAITLSISLAVIGASNIREFKHASNNGFMNYQNKIAKDIRDASKNDPKIVWQIINKCSEKRKHGFCSR
jgi:hypothetical protein